MKIDLLSGVEQGGCSAKIPPKLLEEALSGFAPIKDKNLIVDIETHDDAGVYKISEDIALIFTTDFFPPLCSDPFTFGQIAASNAISDVYAMGGKPLMAVNLMMFPTKELPMEAYTEIMRGGADIAKKAELLIVGGHTIEDSPAKYGMAVIGTVHPDKVATNGGAKVGDNLILTKPLGSGIILAGHRLELASKNALTECLDNAKSLNKIASEIMQKHEIKSATDITGFGLIGHTLEMAKASELAISIDTEKIPLLSEVKNLCELGCIPGAAYSNLKYAEEFCDFSPELNSSNKMICCDAQTSGGLLMAVPEDITDTVLKELHKNGLSHSAIIGKAEKREDKYLKFI